MIESRVRVVQAQKIIGVGRNKILKLCKDQLLVSEMEGNTRLIYTSSIQEYLRNKKAALTQKAEEREAATIQ
ncbi:hypothetical protein [Kiloniella litopenaei]|uniref:hypothetical protein n=1 Tax=Kiloniella litopenaei TaxID=1549748 RepID=UPI003BAA91C3